MVVPFLSTPENLESCMTVYPKPVFSLFSVPVNVSLTLIINPDERRLSLAIAQHIHVHNIRVIDKHQYQLVMDVAGGNEEQMNE